ncbi:MAG: hypothetical protein KY467_08725 [Gemmatimonadetes bacterium]|nr:hypothetical protein [Gemmatimonadota bacterium]
MFRRPLLLLAAALALAACRDGAPAGVIPRETFVAANVALRSLPDTATAQQRAAVLRKHGVTERQLKAWVNGHVREPKVLAKAWEEIAFKLDSLSDPALAPPRPSPTAPGSRIPPPRPQGMPAPGESARIGPPPPPPLPADGEQRRRDRRPPRMHQVQ